MALASVFTEEIILFSLIRKTLSNEKKVGAVILNSVLVGIGFAFLEIIMNVLSARETGVSIGTLPYLSLAIIHITTCIIFGYSASKSVLQSSFLLSAAILLHYIFNFFVMNDRNILEADLFLLIFSLILCLKMLAFEKERDLPLARI
jgi:hypothetical protein